jgi:hypothetical protein
LFKGASQLIYDGTAMVLKSVIRITNRLVDGCSRSDDTIDLPRGAATSSAIEFTKRLTRCAVKEIPLGKMNFPSADDFKQHCARVPDPPLIRNAQIGGRIAKSINLRDNISARAFSASIFEQLGSSFSSSVIRFLNALSSI